MKSNYQIIIEYDGTNYNGWQYQKNGSSIQKEINADGLLATCIQHEIDHLNGILFIDHLSKLKKDLIIKKTKKQKKEIDRVIV